MLTLCCVTLTIMLHMYCYVNVNAPATRRFTHCFVYPDRGGEKKTIIFYELWFLRSPKGCVTHLLIDTFYGTSHGAH